MSKAPDPTQGEQEAAAISPIDFKMRMRAYLYGRHSTLELERLALTRKLENVNQELEVVQELYQEADGGHLRLWVKTIDWQTRTEMLTQACQQALLLIKLLRCAPTIITRADLAVAADLTAEDLEKVLKQLSEGFREGEK